MHILTYTELKIIKVFCFKKETMPGAEYGSTCLTIPATQALVDVQGQPGQLSENNVSKINKYNTVKRGWAGTQALT